MTAFPFVLQDDHMNKRRSRSALAFPAVLETLEGRIALSGVQAASTLPQQSAEVAGSHARRVPTHTTLSVSAGTLSQPITFTVTVRGAASAGSPQGTVNLVDHGKVIQTLTLSPAESTDARTAVSQATYTLMQPAGGSAYYFGRHTISAQFVPSGSFVKSSSNKSFTVAQPTYSTLSDGVKVATIGAGSGAQIQSGQTANVLYTGYLTKNGQIFDDSDSHGGGLLSFTAGAGQVITGFDDAVKGMQVGETRVVTIPPAEAYGSQATGSIPANSTLTFVLTLKSIS